MPLNSDFKERLTKFGRLPIDSVDEQLETLHQKDEKIEKLRKKLKAKNDIISQIMEAGQGSPEELKGILHSLQWKSGNEAK